MNASDLWILLPKELGNTDVTVGLFFFSSCLSLTAPKDLKPQTENHYKKLFDFFS